MANITSRTANWRLLGGGGLLVGGLLFALHVILVQSRVLFTGPWIFVVALLIIAVALVPLAFGETGSNGVVGNYTLGKFALAIYATAFMLFAVNAAAALGIVVVSIAAALLIVGGLVSAYTISRKRVAKGAARVFFFAPALVGALWAMGVVWVAGLNLWGIQLAFALLLAIAGGLFLVNSRRIG